MPSFNAIRALRWPGLLLLCLTLSWLMAAAWADDAAEVSREAVKSSLEQAFPDISVDDIQATPVPGIVEARINGRDMVYVTDDGRFMFLGQLIQVDGEGGVVNLTEKRMSSIRKQALAKVDVDSMITYPAEGEQKAQIYVFTDTTCPFCKRFHRGMEAINAEGVTVHYLAFPRAGVGSSVAQTMSQVWCAKDPQAALTAAKLGGDIGEPRDDCQSPVSKQYHLGQRLGVRGTPAVYDADGHALGGYLSPAQLALKLHLGAAG